MIMQRYIYNGGRRLVESSRALILGTRRRQIDSRCGDADIRRLAIYPRLVKFQNLLEINITNEILVLNKVHGIKCDYAMDVVYAWLLVVNGQ